MTVAAVEVGIEFGAGAGGPHRGLMHFYFFVSSSAVITKIVYNEVLWSPLN